ncbi:MAG: hypothetical protein K2P84_08540 [Undibacterium sp.]|nr:hypothetical protein [Undibacterium sp.]
MDPVRLSRWVLRYDISKDALRRGSAKIKALPLRVVERTSAFTSNLVTAPASTHHPDFVLRGQHN